MRYDHTFFTSCSLHVDNAIRSSFLKDLLHLLHLRCKVGTCQAHPLMFCCLSSSEKLRQSLNGRSDSDCRAVCLNRNGLRRRIRPACWEKLGFENQMELPAVPHLSLPLSSSRHSSISPSQPLAGRACRKAAPHPPTPSQPLIRQPAG